MWCWMLTNNNSWIFFFYWFFFFFHFHEIIWMQQCREQFSCNGSWTWTLFYSTFPVFWQLEALYNTCHILPFPHTFTHWWQRCKLLIRSNLGFSTLFKDTLTCSWGSQGMEPATYRLLDSLLYHPSHSDPNVMVTGCHKLLILIPSKLLCLNYISWTFEAHTDNC